MSTTEGPAEVIRRAATQMRERAEKAMCNGASQPPWDVGMRQDCGCCEAIIDADGSRITTADDRQSDHIASWHPLVALAVADWLDEVAADSHASLDAWVEQAALKVARAYLGEAHAS